MEVFLLNSVVKKVTINCSYGGYASAMAMAREDSPFQCGISVAPVADWRLYSSVYTERFDL